MDQKSSLTTHVIASQWYKNDACSFENSIAKIADAATDKLPEVIMYGNGGSAQKSGDLPPSAKNMSRMDGDTTASTAQKWSSSMQFFLDVMSDKRAINVMQNQETWYDGFVDTPTHYKRENPQVFVHGFFTVRTMVFLDEMSLKGIDELYGEEYKQWLGKAPRFFRNTHHLWGQTIGAVLKPLFTVEEINTIRETNIQKKWKQAFVVPIDSRDTVSHTEDILKEYFSESAEVDAYTEKEHIECLVKSGSWRRYLKKYLRPLDGLSLLPDSAETTYTEDTTVEVSSEDPFVNHELREAFMDGVKTGYNTTPKEFFDFQRAMLCSTAIRYKCEGGSVTSSPQNKKILEFAGPLVDLDSTPMIAYLPDVLRKITSYSGILMVKLSGLWFKSGNGSFGFCNWTYIEREV